MIIIRLSKEPKEGQILYDIKGKAVGRITEVFGPVKGPYASIAPFGEKVEIIAGKKVFSR